MKVRSSALPVVAAAAVLVLAGCGSSGSSTSSAGGTATSSGAPLKVATAAAGTFLETGAGKALYVFAADSPGHSTCTGDCLAYWPADPAPNTVPARVPGVTATLGAITRPDGSKQLTVDGWPVYTYVGDSGPGMTTGQGLSNSGGLWWLVAPSGQQLNSSATPAATPAATPPPRY